MNTLQLEKREEYVIVSMERGRANPINNELVSDIRYLFSQLQDDETVKGVILTGQRNFFSPGLDLIELYGYDKPTMAAFWKNFTEMLWELTKFPKPLIAAISGHSHAGGCLIAICCDYRIMADEPRFKIGLNEVPLGFLLPYGFVELYSFWLGKKEAYQKIMKGHLFNPQDALESGLVDEVHPQEELLSAAEKMMKHYNALPFGVWSKTKLIARKNLIQNSYVSEEEQAATLEQWWNPEFRAMLKKMVGRLSPKKEA